MPRIHALAAALLLPFTLSAGAQSLATPAGPTPMPSAAMSRDCASPMNRHDHGAERGIPAPKARPAPCMAESAASPEVGGPSPKKRPNHDHGKFHKNG